MVDVETLQPLKLAVRLEYLTPKGELRQETRVTPLFLKTNECWKRISVRNEDYFKLNFDLMDQPRTRFLFVKKKFLHQIDIKEFKNLVVNPRESLELSSVKAVLKSSYLWSYFMVLSNESGDCQPNDDKVTLSQPIKKYLVALFKILRKGKSNLLPIYMTYFFGFQKRCESLSFARKLALNAKLISSFEFFLSALTKK